MARTISIGIKLQTDLTPFLTQLDNLKTKLESLGTGNLSGSFKTLKDDSGVLANNLKSSAEHLQKVLNALNQIKSSKALHSLPGGATMLGSEASPNYMLAPKFFTGSSARISTFGKWEADERTNFSRLRVMIGTLNRDYKNPDLLKRNDYRDAAALHEHFTTTVRSNAKAYIRGVEKVRTKFQDAESYEYWLTKGKLSEIKPMLKGLTRGEAITKWDTIKAANMQDTWLQAERAKYDITIARQRHKVAEIDNVSGAFKGLSSRNQTFLESEKKRGLDDAQRAMSQKIQRIFSDINTIGSAKKWDQRRYDKLGKELGEIQSYGGSNLTDAQRLLNNRIRQAKQKYEDVSTNRSDRMDQQFRADARVEKSAYTQERISRGEHIGEARNIIKDAIAERRPLTASERQQVDAYLSRGGRYSGTKLSMQELGHNRSVRETERLLSGMDGKIAEAHERDAAAAERRVARRYRKDLGAMQSDRRVERGDFSSVMFDASVERRATGSLSDFTRTRIVTERDRLLGIAENMRTVAKGGTVAGINLKPEDASKEYERLTKEIRGMDKALVDVDRGFGGALKSALGFGSAVAGIQTMISAMRSLYSAATDVDKAYASIRSSLSRIADPGERSRLKQGITAGVMDDMTSLGMLASESAGINTRVFQGSRGNDADKRALAKTIANLQVSGGLNSEETLAMIAPMTNAGFDASDQKQFLERANTVQGSLQLDQHRMRAFMVAASSALPGIGSVMSWEDAQAAALQEAAGSRDMVMGSKTNRIQIALQNRKTLVRLNEILGRRGSRTSVGGVDIESLINQGNPTATITGIQSLYERGAINDSEITKIGQTIDMWNSPGTIQWLKGGLTPYKRMLRDADISTSRGFVNSNEAAKEATSSLEGELGKLGGAFKSLLGEMSPIGTASKSLVSSLTSTLTGLAKFGDGISFASKALVVLAGSASAAWAAKGVSSAVEAVGGVLAGGGGIRSMGSGLMSALALGATGTAATVGAIGGGIAAAGYFTNQHVLEKINTRYGARVDASNSIAYQNALSDADTGRSILEGASAAQQLATHLQSGASATDKMADARKRVISAIVGQLKSESEILRLNKLQTSELLQQMKLRTGGRITELQGRKEEAANTRIAEYFNRGEQTGFNSLSPEGRRASLQYLARLAAATNKPELVKWSEQATKELNGGLDLTGPGPAAALRNAFYKAFLSANGVTLPSNQASVSPDVIENISMSGHQKLGHHYNKLPRTKFGLDRDYAGKNAAETKDGARLDQEIINVDHQMEILNTTEAAGKPASNNTLVAVANALLAKGVSNEDANRIIETRLRADKDGGKQIRMLIKSLQDKGLAKFAKLSQSFVRERGGSLGTRTPDPRNREEALAAFSRPGFADTFNDDGGYELKQAARLTERLNSIGPEGLEPAGKVDVDKGVDPFKQFKEMLAGAKSASSTGSVRELMAFLNNPTLSTSFIDKRGKQFIQEALNDNTINMGGAQSATAIRELAEARLARYKQEVSPASFRKLIKGSVSAAMKEGSLSSTGDILLSSEADTISETKDKFFEQHGRFAPENEHDAKLWELEQKKWIADALFNRSQTQAPYYIEDIKQRQAAYITKLKPGSDEHRSASGLLSFMTTNGDNIIKDLQSDAQNDRRLTERQIVLQRANIALDRGLQNLPAMQASQGFLAGFQSEETQRAANRNLLDLQIKAHKESLEILKGNTGLLGEQRKVESAMLDLMRQRLLITEESVRLQKAVAAGDQWGRNTVSTLLMGDAKDRNATIRKSITNQILSGTADRFYSTLTELGGGNNPLAKMGQILFDPTGDKRAIAVTELLTQALKENKSAVEGLTLAIKGGDAAPQGGSSAGGFRGFVTSNTVRGSLTPDSGTLTDPISGQPIMLGSSPVTASQTGSVTSRDLILSGAFMPQGTGLMTMVGLGLGGGLLGSGISDTNLVGATDSNGFMQLPQSQTTISAEEFLSMTPGQGTEQPRSKSKTAQFWDGAMGGANKATLGGWGNKDPKVKRGTGVNADGTLNAEGKGAVGMAVVGGLASAYSSWASQKDNGRAAQNYAGLGSGLMAAAGVAAMFGPMGMAVGAVLAVAGVAAQLMAGKEAGDKQARDKEREYAQKEAEFQRAIAQAELARINSGMAAERILAARADVSNVFSGIGASAFLSGRFGQTAPTITVQTLTVQANNPTELSTALAQGVSRELRMGA